MAEIGVLSQNPGVSGPKSGSRKVIPRSIHPVNAHHMSQLGPRSTRYGRDSGLFGSDRAGTALARQQSVARFWQLAAYQLNVFALT
jgi:hypothetical protein